MKQFKALLTKEWQTHRKALMLPVWFTIAVYAIALLGYIINLLRTGNVWIEVTLPEADMIGANVQMITWVASYISFTVLGFISLFTGMSLADALLNGDYRKKCEILHLSQPVSLQKILCSKFLFVTIGALLILLLLSLFNASVITIGAAILTKNGTGFGYLGAIQGFMHFSFTYLFAVSLLWFFAAVFKNRSGLNLIIFFVAIEVATQLLNKLYGWTIPSLLSYLMRLLFSNMEINTCQLSNPNMMKRIIEQGWSVILSVDNLMKSIYSVFFLIGSYFIYKRREIA